MCGWVEERRGQIGNQGGCAAGLVHLSEAVYWGKQAESAILAALGYGGCGGDIPGDARWWVGDADAACAVAMVPRPLLRFVLLFGLSIGRRLSGWGEVMDRALVMGCLSSDY